MRRFSKTTLLASLTLVIAGTSAPAPADCKEKSTPKEESVLAVTDSTFSKEVLKSDKPVLVDFWAPWCGPCRKQGPIIEEVSSELKGKAKVVKLNTDENPKCAQTYNLGGIPALIIFKNGKIVEQKLGLTEKDALLQTINKHL